jgi:type II secretory ATPase GspE/PulE/Tfp pilus assembly ATPase PilB-like protein
MLAKLNAINNEGGEFQLLAPFFEMLLPAFTERADEIRIEPAGSKLKIICNGNSSFVPLPDSPRNYAAIAFSRILILSEMNIALEGAEQTGVFKVRYNRQIISVNVVSRRDDDGWFVIFRPEWDRVESVNESSRKFSA